MKLKNAHLLSAIFICPALTLTACGGGGGGASPSIPPVVTTSTYSCPSGQIGTYPNCITPASLQIAAPPPYSSGSNQLAAFNALNKFRLAQGLGPVNQNAQLDAAAAAHVTYMIDNFGAQAPTDYETTGLPGFTGVDPTSRAVAQGYAGAGATAGVDEVMDSEITSGSTRIGFGAESISSLIGTVYHRSVMQSQSVTDVGISIGTSNVTLAGVANTVSFDCINLGAIKAQSNASNYVGVYPGDGQLGVGLHANYESPSPIPAVTTPAEFEAQTGYPISLSVTAGLDLAVTTFTVTPVGQSTALPAKIITGSDPTGFIGQEEVFLLPSVPLQPNTAYSVKFIGMANGTSIAKSWTFTTGS